MHTTFATLTSGVFGLFLLASAACWGEPIVYIPHDRDSDQDGLTDREELGRAKYEIVVGKFSWHEAKAEAEKMGGHLATFGIGGEYTYFLETVLHVFWVPGVGPRSDSHLNLWIGGLQGLDTGELPWWLAPGEPPVTVGNEPWKWIPDEYGVLPRVGVNIFPGRDGVQWRDGEPNDNHLGGSVQGDHEDYLMIWGNETGGEAYWNDAKSDGGLLSLDGFVLETGRPSDTIKADSDQDGLNDKRERDLQTDPWLSDTDGDGETDLVEVENQTDPVDEKSNSASTLTIQPAVALRFRMAPGYKYAVYSKDALDSNSVWTFFAEPVDFPGSPPNTGTVFAIQTDRERFFRVERSPATP